MLLTRLAVCLTGVSRNAQSRVRRCSRDADCREWSFWGWRRLRRCSASSALCDRVLGDAMTLLSLLLSVAAFVYLVYAMLRPEKF